MVGVAAYRGNTFSAHPSGCAFYLTRKTNMKDKLFADFFEIDPQNIHFALDKDPPFTDSKRTLEDDDPPISPSLQGRNCLGSGRHNGYECLCNECNHFLFCYPQYDFRRPKRKPGKSQRRLRGKLFSRQRSIPLSPIQEKGKNH